MILMSYEREVVTKRAAFEPLMGQLWHDICERGLDREAVGVPSERWRAHLWNRQTRMGEWRW